MERQIHVIGCGVIEKDRKILLVQEGKDVFPGVKGKWNLPTGKLDPRENMEECSIRETKEETGLDIELNYLIGIYQYHKEFPDKLVDVMRFAYKGTIISDTEFKKTDEVANVEWFSMEEIDRMNESGELRSEEVYLVVKDYFSGKKLPKETLTIVR